MKYVFIFSLLALSNLFSNAQAVTIDKIQAGISMYANSVTNHTGNYFDQSFVYDNQLSTEDNFSSPINAVDLTSTVTGGDLSTYAWTPDAHLSTDINSNYIDLSFGDTGNAYNGEGADLVLFFAGNATLFQDGHKEDFLFSIEIDGFTSSLLGVITSETDNIKGYDFFASYALINLDDFGFAANASVNDIRVFLGDSSMPALATVGAYNATVVPLPISSVLFGSGLMLLSLFRRKKA